MMTAILDKSTPSKLEGIHIEAFLEHLRTEGYTKRTIIKKRTVITAFVRWAKSKQIALDCFDESDISAFVKCSPGMQKVRVKFELAALRLLLEYLRAKADLPLPVSEVKSSTDDLLLRYIDYLRQDLGLAVNSVRTYVPFIHDFLNQQCVDRDCLTPNSFDAQMIRSYLLAHLIGHSSEYSRLMATALRSFFHFLFLRGDTPIDLCVSVPSAHRWRQSSVPAYLTPEEEERAIATADRSTDRGCRDYAILLLLARLGLRAGEIVSLKLDDLRWRSGQIVVHGKNGHVEYMPMLSDIGEALVIYLQEHRGTSTSRSVFLRMLAPRVGLAGPGAIGHIVRLAFVRAGIHHSSRGAAQLFRHSLATTMIRHGATMAEIAEVLRHHSLSSTAIYAKVSFEALRDVARPWPATGVAK